MKNIRIKPDGLKLEQIAEGDTLVFAKGRKEIVFQVDHLNNTLYTTRITSTSGRRKIKNSYYNTKEVYLNSRGETYDPTKLEKCPAV